MSDTIEVKHPFAIRHDDGSSTVLNLTPNEMEQIGFSLVHHASSLRPKDSRPIREQPKVMAVESPPLDLVAQTDPDGKRSIALVWKANEMRPIWLWYDADVATKIAHDILTIAADDGPIAN